ncbi:hypothetical protein [Streptomyces sp. CAU 1734]|uniref:hypothetical protein n=1 Tax=Streptomyces sp. CAU 1734 TaxID=3140360 RepID=UPI0032600F49
MEFSLRTGDGHALIFRDAGIRLSKGRLSPTYDVEVKNPAGDTIATVVLDEDEWEALVRGAQALR